MTSEEWEGIYRKAWHLYYSPEHIETILRRARATGLNTGRVASMIFAYYASHAFEGVHPLQSGVFRRKRRRQRRPGFGRENPFVFYPRRSKEILATYVPGLWFLLKLELRQFSDIGIPLSEPNHTAGRGLTVRHCRR
jgi:hypothetical protein